MLRHICDNVATKVDIVQIPFNEPFTSANISSLFGSVKLIPNYLPRLSQIIERGAMFSETYV